MKTVNQIIFFVVVALLPFACQQKSGMTTYNGLVFDTIRQHHWKKFQLTRDRLSGFDTVHLNGAVYYIIEGDLLVTAEQLKDRLAKDSASLTKVNKPKIKPQHLLEQKAIIEFNTITLDTIKWEKFPIRYCIDKHSFAAKTGWYDKVRASVQQAALDWQAVCGVKITYINALDDKPGITPGSDVDFVIRYKNFANSAYVATSFFPEDSIGKRVLLIYPSYWTTSYDPIGVFRHEFGHIFGFRHEETANSPAVPTFCKQTPAPHQTSVGMINYDRVSVMHYYCGGNGTRTLDFSSNDKITFPLIYPKLN